MIHDHITSPIGGVSQVLIANHAGRRERVVELGRRQDLLRWSMRVDAQSQLLGLLRLQLMIQELLRCLIC
jgi:hypothetical protein